MAAQHKSAKYFKISIGTYKRKFALLKMKRYMQPDHVENFPKYMYTDFANMSWH